MEFLVDDGVDKDKVNMIALVNVLAEMELASRCFYFIGTEVSNYSWLIRRFMYESHPLDRTPHERDKLL